MPPSPRNLCFVRCPRPALNSMGRPPAKHTSVASNLSGKTMQRMCRDTECAPESHDNPRLCVLKLVTPLPKFCGYIILLQRNKSRQSNGHLAAGGRVEPGELSKDRREGTPLGQLSRCKAVSLQGGFSPGARSGRRKVPKCVVRRGRRGTPTGTESRKKCERRVWTGDRSS
jgi:hypothetical protein